MTDKVSNTSEFLWKFTITVSKICEVVSWIGTACMAVLLIISFTKEDYVLNFQSRLFGPAIFADMDVLGMQLAAPAADQAGQIIILRLVIVTGIIGLSLYAMLFRNINLILRTSRGGTWFSEGDTPFQKPVVRMIREIGIFMLLVPVVQLGIAGIARLMMTGIEASVSLSSVLPGLLLLCLAQCFEKGITLEKETEGLI